MVQKISETKLRLLTLIKLDATHLHERIKYRKREYLGLFALKRSREPFNAIFLSKYDQVQVKNLLECSEELIVSIDLFYSEVEQLKWYLFHTEDMPVTVEDEVERHVKKIDQLFDDLMIMLQAELEVED